MRGRCLGWWPGGGQGVESLSKEALVGGQAGRRQPGQGWSWKSNFRRGQRAGQVAQKDILFVARETRGAPAATAATGSTHAASTQWGTPWPVMETRSPRSEPKLLPEECAVWVQSLSGCPFIPRSKEEGRGDRAQPAWAGTQPVRVGQTGVAAVAAADPQCGGAGPTSPSPRPSHRGPLLSRTLPERTLQPLAVHDQGGGGRTDAMGSPCLVHAAAMPGPSVFSLNQNL